MKPAQLDSDFLYIATSPSLGKKPMSLPAEFWYAYMNPPISPISPPVTIDGPLIPGFIPNNPNTREKLKLNIEFKELQNLNKKHEDTREIADGDRDTSDSGESEVIKGAEIGYHLCEGRVSIYHWIFRLCRSCNVSIHPPLVLSL